MKLLALSASARQGSFNLALLQLAAAIAEAAGAQVQRTTIRDFALPLYDGDLEAAEGLPPAARAFKEQLAAADGLLLATPEYNAGIPGTLKNLIDWGSRGDTDCYTGKPVLLLAASPSVYGGSRGMWHARVPLEGLGCHVHPEMYALPSAHEAFDAAGALRDPKRQERLARAVQGYLEFVRALASSRST